MTVNSEQYRDDFSMQLAAHPTFTTYIGWCRFTLSDRRQRQETVKCIEKSRNFDLINDLRTTKQKESDFRNDYNLRIESTGKSLKVTIVNGLK